MKEKVEAIYKRLQTLDIKPTKENMEKLIKSLYDLEDIYKELRDEDGRTEADPE